MQSNYLKIVTTAAVNVRYKGQQYVIQAIPKLNKIGIRVEYHIIGEGDSSYLRDVAKRCGVEDQVVFQGRLPLKEVFNLLDEVDVYIQPSLQEGLPRSVIEALSRGCLAIGARTAGIPELLEDEYVVRRKSVKDIVNCLSYISNLTSLEKCRTAKRNFYEAKKYCNDVLDATRGAYYESIILEENLK